MHSPNGQMLYRQNQCSAVGIDFWALRIYNSTALKFRTLGGYEVGSVTFLAGLGGAVIPTYKELKAILRYCEVCEVVSKRYLRFREVCEVIGKSLLRYHDVIEVSDSSQFKFSWGSRR